MFVLTFLSQWEWLYPSLDILGLHYVCTCACVWVHVCLCYSLEYFICSLLQSTVRCVFFWYPRYYIHRLNIYMQECIVMDEVIPGTKPRYLMLVVAVLISLGSVISSSYLAAVIIVFFLFSNHYFHWYFTCLTIANQCFQCVRFILLPSSFIQYKVVWLKSLLDVFSYSCHNFSLSFYTSFLKNNLLVFLLWY